MSEKWLPLAMAVQMVLRADSYCLDLKMSEIYFFRFFKPLEGPFLAPKCVKMDHFTYIDYLTKM